MNDTEDLWTVLILVAMVAVALFFCGHHIGYKSGVRDHAAGRYVVVTLPNGKDIVCEVKETANDPGKAK